LAGAGAVMATWTRAGFAVTPPTNHATISLHLDFDLLGIFGVGHVGERLVACGAQALVGGQLDVDVAGRQMAEIASLRATLLFLGTIRCGRIG
jgi:hypothetical protein